MSPNQKHVVIKLFWSACEGFSMQHAHHVDFRNTFESVLHPQYYKILTHIKFKL